jgi:hypothetical protein
MILLLNEKKKDSYVKKYLVKNKSLGFKINLCSITEIKQYGLIVCNTIIY